MHTLPNKRFVCMDCGKNTFNEYYMLYTSVWKKANPKIKGQLCISCLELRLGRKLAKKDFTKAPINTMKTERTAKLKNRMSN